MTTPLIRAFFLGRAAAEVLAENVERAMADVLSELGKFDAEQRVYLRSVIDQINARADRDLTEAEQQRQTSSPDSVRADMASVDLQAMIDDLRAEIAEVRAELQRYRSSLI
jgi:hypothetical protein